GPLERRRPGEGREVDRREAGARRRRRGLRVRHRPARGLGPGVGDRHPGVVAAPGALPDRADLEERQQDRGPGVHQEAPEHHGPQGTAEVRVRRAEAARATVVSARRLAFNGLLLLCTFLSLAFLVLPLVAIFARVPLRHLLDQLSSPVAQDAMRLSFETNVISLGILLLVGTPAAYLIGRHRFRGRTVVLTAIELPLVLPPSVAGIGLLAAFNGRTGLVPDPLGWLGISFDFSTSAVTLAVLFVSSPFYLRQAIASFETIELDTIEAARTLGAGPGRTFLRVALPLAAGSLGAGAALAFARGIGEVRATVMFPGNFQGITQTLPLAIYQVFESDFDTALALGALLVVFSAAILLTVKLLSAWTRSISTSTSRSATLPFAPTSA